MKASIGRVLNSTQDAAEYGKKPNAKATIAEAEALSRMNMIPAMAVARFAVLLAVAAFITSVIALVVTVVR